MSADAYRKCLRALMRVAPEHDNPAARASIESAYSAFSAMLVAADPEAREAVVGEPFRPWLGTATKEPNFSFGIKRSRS